MLGRGVLYKVFQVFSTLIFFLLPYNLLLLLIQKKITNILQTGVTLTHADITWLKSLGFHFVMILCEIYDCAGNGSIIVYCRDL